MTPPSTARFDSGAGSCSNAGNADQFGLHRGSFGNPAVFAGDGRTMAVGLVPVDDVFETHAHAYQRAVRRMPTQVRKTPSWPRSWADFSLCSCVPT